MAVADWQHSPNLDATERLVVEFADALSRTPVDMSDDLRRRLGERFSRRQLVELANAVAWEHARARFNRALDISSDEFSTR